MGPEVQAAIDALKMELSADLEKAKQALHQAVEDAAKKAALGGMQIAEAYVKSTKTPFDDILFASVKQAASDELVKLADKIKA